MGPTEFVFFVDALRTCFRLGRQAQTILDFLGPFLFPIGIGRAGIITKLREEEDFVDINHDTRAKAGGFILCCERVESRCSLVFHTDNTQSDQVSRPEMYLLNLGDGGVLFGLFFGASLLRLQTPASCLPREQQWH